MQPDQIVAVGCEPGKEPLDARDRRERLPAWSEVRRRAVVRPVGQACAHRARARGHARASCPTGTASGSSRWATSAPRGSGSPARPRPACWRISIPSAPAWTAYRRSRSPARSSTSARPTGRSSRRRPPPGPRSCSPTSAQDEAMAALTEQIVHILRLDEPDPDRRLARARRHARRGRRAAERARLRRAALRGPGHGPDDRAARRARPGRRRASRRSTASSTCRTCRPRRSSRPPTRRARPAT